MDLNKIKIHRHKVKTNQCELIVAEYRNDGKFNGAVVHDLRIGKKLVLSSEQAMKDWIVANENFEGPGHPDDNLSDLEYTLKYA